MNEFIIRLDLDFILIYVAIFGFSDIFIRMNLFTIKQELMYYSLLFFFGILLFVYNKFFYKK
jgi:hypothetical protein